MLGRGTGKLDFLRSAAWLDAGRARGYLWLIAGLNLAMLAYLVGSARGGVDSRGFLLGTDFVSFWTTGRMLHADRNVYDVAAHIAEQRAFHAPSDGYTGFFYPPWFLPFCYPLGWFGYFPALAGWLLATGGAFVLAVRTWVRRFEAPIPVPLLVAVAAFPPVSMTIMHGQTSFLAAALLGLGVLFVPQRPLLAGALLGLAVFKPQLGVLLPLVLLSSREWRVIAAAVVTAGGLGVLATAAFGPEVWRHWWHVGAAAQGALEGVVGYAKMQSPFAAAMLLGAGPSAAYAIQGVISFGVAGALVWAGWRRPFGPALGAALLAGIPLATPFILDYDLVLLAFPLVWLAAAGFRPWEKLAVATSFAAAAFARPLGLTIGLPITPFVLLWLFVLLLRRAGEERSAERRGASLGDRGPAA